MTFYAVRNTYVDSPELAEVKPVHRDYLRTLIGEDGLLAAGPLADTSPPAALLIFQSTSADAVKALMVEDPLYKANLITRQTIEEWSPMTGPAFT